MGFFEWLRLLFKGEPHSLPLRQPVLSEGERESYYHRQQRDYFMNKRKREQMNMGDMNYYQTPGDSFMLTRYNIEPGQIVKISSEDFNDQWSGGSQFYPQHCIYVGSPDLWLLHKGSQANGVVLVAADTPLDTYRPPAPSFVTWPVYSCTGHVLELVVENRGKNIGHFVARLAGRFQDYAGYRPTPRVPCPIPGGYQRRP